MLTLQTRLRLNQAEAAATVIEGEAIMMNLAQGIYYSTDGVGARIWELAVAGAPLGAVSETLTVEYAVSREQAEQDVLRLTEQFVAERLLVLSDETAAPAPVAPTRKGAAYTSPSLEIYREMGHLLALDPPMPGIENLSWDEPQANATP